MKIFLCLLLCLLLPSCSGISQQQDARRDQPVAGLAPQTRGNAPATPDRRFLTVKKVYDGDTVLLEDGRKIRLLGINTPEIAHGNRVGEAGGEQAKAWLTEKLLNQPVRLEIGVEKTDHYGRTLAHLFNTENEHINLQLVANGMASVEIFPPNLAYAGQLASAEQHAETAHLGIWQMPEYAPIAVAALADAHPHGWTRAIGRINAVQATQHGVNLVFSERFAVHIEQRNVPLFGELNDYLNKSVEVRGWIHQRKGHLVMLVRHPSAIKR